MRKLAIIAVLSACLGAFAQDAAVVTTLFSDGTTNTWTQADLVAALQLINRKYHRDCQGATGRQAWHGRMTETVTTNGDTLVKTEIHEDGTRFTFTAPYVPPAVAVSNANARLTRAVDADGVPKALKAARKRRLQEVTTVSNVNVTVEANVR